MTDNEVVINKAFFLPKILPRAVTRITKINEKIPAAVFLDTEKTTNVPEVLKGYKSFYFKFFQ